MCYQNFILNNVNRDWSIKAHVKFDIKCFGPGGATDKWNNVGANTTKYVH